MPELKRVLGLPMLTFYGTGMILGAGVYSITGKAAALAGESLWLSFTLASICAFLSALSYAELSALIPRAGGEYVFLSHAFPRRNWLAICTGLLMTFSCAASATAVALAFGGYLSHFLNLSAELVGTLLIIVFSILNARGISESSKVNVIFTLLEAGGLILIIIMGSSSSSFGEAIGAVPSTGTLSAAALTVFAFLGFENLVNFTEDAKNPQRDIPKSILISLGISTSLYILVSLAVLSLASPKFLSNSSAPLMDAVIGKSKIAGNILGAIALVSTANTVLISLLTGGRILYGIGKGKGVPDIFAKVSARRRTPWIAELAVTSISLLLIPLGSVEITASLSSFSTMLSFVMVNVALITLRFSAKNLRRPFRVPFNVWQIPIPTLLGIMVTIVLLMEFKPLVYAIVLGFFALGFLILKYTRGAGA